MKNIDEVLKNRMSYRKYNDIDVENEVIEEVLALAQKTATSINGQQISLVITKDKEKLKKISEINWGQKHIAQCSFFITFVIDFNRPDEALNLSNKEMYIHNDIESLIAGSVDAGLMAQSVEMLLQSRKIGTCMIGGIRQDMQGISNIIGLSGKAIPILGMTVGNVDKFENEDLRPRIKNETFRFFEKYDEDTVRKEVVNYNDILNKWWDKKGLKGHRSYSDVMGMYYTKEMIKDELEQIQSFGFLKKYEENK